MISYDSGKYCDKCNEPETHLTADDKETIRIHLGAFKEELCNQGRYTEAEEYEEIINRLMSLPTAEPKIILCEDCKQFKVAKNGVNGFCNEFGICMDTYDYCSHAERQEDK